MTAIEQTSILPKAKVVDAARFGDAHPWIKQLPRHWATSKLKWLAQIKLSNIDKKTVEGQIPVQLCNYVDVYKNDFIRPNMEFMKATATPSQVNTFTLRAGDVLITKDSEEWNDIAVPAFVENRLDGVLCGYHLALIRPAPAVSEGRYLFRAFAAEGIADQFRVAANGITRFGLGGQDIADALFPVPPIDEQRAIAAFLDRKTADIDAVIAKKQRMIELMHEKRLAIVNQVVTKGLDPNVKMRDSEIEWLGMFPSHWQVGRLKFQMLGIVQGWSPQCENRQAEPGEWGVLKVGCMNSSVYDESENKALPTTETPLPEYEVRVGDVLMSRSNTVELVGAVGMVHRTQGRILLCDKLYRLAFDQRQLLPTYAVHLLRARIARSQVERDATGASSSMKNISNDRVHNLVLPIPPVKEQEMIVHWIEDKMNQIGFIVDRTRQHIERLAEYRRAIIAAAVTGQMKVARDVINNT